jgi:hypothetical protein
VPPALRLVVVWMVGALALAAAWCVHVLREGQRVAAAPAPVLAPPSPAAPAVDETRGAIARYLRIRYDGAADSFAYAGEPLTEIENSALLRLLPDTRFFATKLHGVLGGLIDLQVDLLVSFKRAPGPADDIRSWPLHAGDGPAHGFLTQFLGISASTWSERRDLALALAQLLAATTDGGSARSSTRCFMDTYAELWRGRAPWLGREHWRDVYVFSENGRVSRVTVWNQIDHRLEAKVSSYRTHRCR